MEVAAKLRHVRISAQKCRLSADLVRGMPVGKALEVLTFTPLKSAGIVKKVIGSAIANAEHNLGADVDELFIRRIFVDEGPMLKRIMPRAKGRANRILKRSSHVTVVLSDKGEK